ncbi:hypothetical protein RAH41_06285 [Gottfriedia acidiceleris]|uniref:hypothetical protein n=1 Tax=Gottfriedia acidiceleris TaxID=371036 RepID=UPI002F269189
MSTGRKIQWLGCLLGLCSLFINLVTENKQLSILIALFGGTIVLLGIVFSVKTKNL